MTDAPTPQRAASAEERARLALADWLAGELLDENTGPEHHRYAAAIFAGPLAPILDRDRLADEVARLSAELASARSTGMGRSEAEAMRERCAKAALGASYGPPSSWPGDYPKGWKHPPCWEPEQKPTPGQAAWHDNGARDAWFAIRAIPAQAAGGGS